MKDLLESIEQLINTIGREEFKKNPKASAKALVIKNMIKEIRKKKVSNNDDPGILKYLSSKKLLEN